jgi:hypothetical protein
MFYLPFISILDDEQRTRFTRAQVDALIQRAIHQHQRMQAELNSGGNAARKLKQTFALLEGLNAKKNAGLYVDFSGGKVHEPNSVSRNDLAGLIELADALIETVGAFVSIRMSAEQKRIAQEETRKMAKQVRRLGRRASEARHANESSE